MRPHRPPFNLREPLWRPRMPLGEESCLSFGGPHRPARSSSRRRSPPRLRCGPCVTATQSGPPGHRAALFPPRSARPLYNKDVRPPGGLPLRPGRILSAKVARPRRREAGRTSRWAGGRQSLGTLGKISLPGRSERCRGFQKLTGPFRTLPRFSEACPAVQNVAAVFRSLPRRSEPCRGFQKLTGPFRTLPGGRASLKRSRLAPGGPRS